MRKDNFYITGYIQVFMFIVTSAYPMGAPEEACSNMSPKQGHSISSQPMSSNPYTISTSSSSYCPGQVITVKVSGPGFFKGILLQARRSGSGHRFNDPEGSFDQLPDTLTFLTCNNVSNSTVTHTHSSDKQEIQLDWIAPQYFIGGNIKFYATIVQNISTFWIRVRSTNIMEQRKETTQEPSVTDTTLITLISDSANTASTSEYSTRDKGELGKTSSPSDFHNETIATFDSTGSPLNNTTLTVLPSDSSLTVDDTIPTTVESEIVTSADVTVSTETDVHESTTFDYSAQTNVTTYQSHVTSDVTNETHTTSPYITTINSITSSITKNMDVTTIPLGSTSDSILLGSPTGTTPIHQGSTSGAATIPPGSTTDPTTIPIGLTTDSTTIPRGSITGISGITYDVTLTTQQAQTTDNDMTETSPPEYIATEQSTLHSMTDITNVTSTDFYTTESKTTPDPIQDSLTDVLTETYTIYDLTDNYTQRTEPMSSTTNIPIESDAGKPVSMVTNLADTLVVFKMTITSIEFTDSLTDRSSNEFIELAESIQTIMDDIYSTWQGFQECKIVNFTPGSVVSETELVFDTPLSEEEKVATVGELYRLVEENGGIGNYTVSDIQTVSNEGTYVVVDPCYLLPCPVDLYCYVEESKCILLCEENTDFCQNGDCSLDDDGKHLSCSNFTVESTSRPNSKEFVIAMVLIGASVFLIVLSLTLFVFICKLWKKRRRSWRRRQNQDIQLFGFENNKHIRLNGGIPIADVSGSRGRYFVEVNEINETPFFSRHPTDLNISGRGSIGSVDRISVFDRAFSSAGQSDLDEHDYDYDVINRNRSVTFIETPQILGDDQSAEEFGIENFSFGVPKYVDREDGGGSYRVRWDFKVDDPATTDMDIAL